MKIRMDYAAIVALIVAICTIVGAYGLPGGDAQNVESPLFDVRMDQAVKEMGAGIPGIDLNNAWSFGSINEKSLATSNELTQSADAQAARALAWWTRADTCGFKQTCRWTCADTCARTCWETCKPTCWQTCGVTCAGFTCWRTCGATCGNKATCLVSCGDLCCLNNRLSEVRE